MLTFITNPCLKWKKLLHVCWKSLGGFLYYVTFIYDFSLKVWICSLKTKDEFFDRFQKEFRAQVELIDFCMDTGIKRMLMVPYNHQQNDIVGRNNRTITEATTAMIHEQSHLWFYGEKPPRQILMSKIEVLAMYWGIRLLNKSSQVRSRKLDIWESLVVLSTFMCPRKRGPRWSLLGRRNIYWIQRDYEGLHNLYSMTMNNWD